MKAMAAATRNENIRMECGFCLQVDDDLVDPKQLPCSHTHCGPCLKGAFSVANLLKCPHCRYNMHFLNYLYRVWFKQVLNDLWFDQRMIPLSCSSICKCIKFIFP